MWEEVLQCLDVPLIDVLTMLLPSIDYDLSNMIVQKRFQHSDMKYEMMTNINHSLMVVLK